LPRAIGNGTDQRGCGKVAGCVAVWWGSVWGSGVRGVREEPEPGMPWPRAMCVGRFALACALVERAEKAARLLEMSHNAQRVYP